jgi:hypothetical protein
VLDLLVLAGDIARVAAAPAFWLAGDTASGVAAPGAGQCPEGDAVDRRGIKSRCFVRCWLRDIVALITCNTLTSHRIDFLNFEKLTLSIVRPPPSSGTKTNTTSCLSVLCPLCCLRLCLLILCCPCATTRRKRNLMAQTAFHLSSLGKHGNGWWEPFLKCWVTNFIQVLNFNGRRNFQN